MDSALSAAQSVQVELLSSFSPDYDREIPVYVSGEMSAAALYHSTVAATGGKRRGARLCEPDNTPGINARPAQNGWCLGGTRTPTF
jgi:hypothetical protein